MTSNAASLGGLTVSKLRQMLSDESTRVSTVLNAWSGIPGLIPENDIIKVIKEKCHCLNNEELEESGKEKDKAITVVDSDLGASDEE